jgi:hypothetical protein
MKVRWLTSDGRADRRLKRTRLTLGCPSRQLWRTAEMGGFLPVPICPTGHAYVLLAALGQRRDGRQLIGLDRFLEIGMGNTRDPSEKTKIAAGCLPVGSPRSPLPRGRA